MGATGGVRRRRARIPQLRSAVPRSPRVPRRAHRWEPIPAGLRDSAGPRARSHRPSAAQLPSAGAPRLPLRACSAASGRAPGREPVGAGEGSVPPPQRFEGAMEVVRRVGILATEQSLWEARLGGSSWASGLILYSRYPKVCYAKSTSSIEWFTCRIQSTSSKNSEACGWNQWFFQKSKWTEAVGQKYYKTAVSQIQNEPRKMLQKGLTWAWGDLLEWPHRLLRNLESESWSQCCVHCTEFHI